MTSREHSARAPAPRAAWQFPRTPPYRIVRPTMGKRDKLSSDGIATFLAGYSEWTNEDEGGAIARTFAFDDYASAVAFAVRVAFAAEKHDHHPDLHISWGKVRVQWSTHDAGGVTQVDTEMADVTEKVYKAG